MTEAESAFLNLAIIATCLFVVFQRKAELKRVEEHVRIFREYGYHRHAFAYATIVHVTYGFVLASGGWAALNLLALALRAEQ